MRKFLLFVALAGIAGAQTMTEFGAAAAAGTAGGAAGKKVSDGITSIFGKVDQQTKTAAKGDDAKSKPPSAATKASASPAPEAAASVASGPAPSSASGPAPNAGNGPAGGSTPVAKYTPATKTAPTAKTATKAEHSARVTRTDPPEPPNSVPDPPPIQRAVVSKPAPPPAPKPEVVFAPLPPPPPPPPVATAEDLKAIAPGTNREDVLKLGAPASRITMFDDGHVLEIYTYAASNATFGVVRLSDGAVSKVELR